MTKKPPWLRGLRARLSLGFSTIGTIERNEETTTWSAQDARKRKPRTVATGFTESLTDIALYFGVFGKARLKTGIKRLIND